MTTRKQLKRVRAVMAAEEAQLDQEIAALTTALGENDPQVLQLKQDFKGLDKQSKHLNESMDRLDNLLRVLDGE